MTKKIPLPVTSRNESFTERTVTKIWQERPSQENPYIAESARCHGYDLHELMEKRSFIDVLYLLFRSELPTIEESKILEQLMIGLINPGPRHPATRAAMNAGVGKTDPLHILPIALTIYGGNANAAGSIEATMRFFRKHRNSDPTQLANELASNRPMDIEGDWQVAPGFSSSYGGIDIMASKLAAQLSTLDGCGPSLTWGMKFAENLSQYQLGWYHSGVAAAVLSDLGFQPRVCGGLFQMFASPGLFAHGVELANKPRTAMPYVKDENYLIEYENE